MNFKFHKHTLNLKHPFTLSRGSRVEHDVLIVEIEENGITAFGEASPLKRYDETIESCQFFFSSIDLKQFSLPNDFQNVLNYIHQQNENYAAKCSIEIALYDWIGKYKKIPLWKFLNGKKVEKISSFTIAGGNIEEIKQKVFEAEKFPILKIKLGFENDEEIINEISKITDKPLFIDANEGWKNKKTALNRISFLENFNIHLIEQPLPSNLLKEMNEIKLKSKISLIADESFHFIEDIEKIKNCFDGINLKLMKCGGISNAIKIIEEVKKNNLKILLGSMIETSIGISAASQLISFVDYLDIDGNMLISNDLFEGTKNENGKIILSDDFGIGVKLR